MIDNIVQCAKMRGFKLLFFLKAIINAIITKLERLGIDHNSVQEVNAG